MGEKINYINQILNIIILNMVFIIYIVSTYYIMKSCIFAYKSKFTILAKELIFLISMIALFKSLISIIITMQYFYFYIFNSTLVDHPFIIIFNEWIDGVCFLTFCFSMSVVVTWKNKCLDIVGSDNVIEKEMKKITKILDKIDYSLAEICPNNCFSKK